MLRDRAIIKQSGFSRKGNKQDGVSAGYIAQENKTGNTFILKHFYKSYKDCLTPDKQKWDNQALSDRTDGVQELIGSSMYQFLLYDRAPKEELVVPNKANKNSLYVRSKFFDNVVQLSEFSGLLGWTRVRGNDLNLQKLEGFEKVIAACHMLGEGDYHAGNLMVQDGKTVVKIDHGKSFMTFHQDFGSMIEETYKMFSHDGVGYTEAIRQGNLSFSIEKYSKSLEQMIHQLDEQQIEAMVDQKVDELKKVGFDPKGLTVSARLQDNNFENISINNFDELRIFYKENIKENLNNMKEIAKSADIVSKFSDVSPEFKKGQWLEAFARSPIKDPIAYAAHHNIQIEGKTALEWASENNYQIKVPVHSVTEMVQEVQWKRSEDGTWQEQKVSVPKNQKSVTSLDPAQYVTDVEKRLKSLGDKIDDFVQKTVKSKEITEEQIERFYDKLLTHLNKEQYLTNKDVEKIKADTEYNLNIQNTTKLIEITTPNLTNIDKMCYKAANFCKKIGLSSLSNHLMNKITPENLSNIKKIENVLTESIKFKETLLKPRVSKEVIQTKNLIPQAKKQNWVGVN